MTDSFTTSLTNSFERIQTTCADLHILIDAAYERLGRPSNYVRPQLTHVFTKAIKWVLCARRPLLSDELLEAISSMEGRMQVYSTRPNLNTKADNTTTIAALIDDCWGCITVNSDDVVQIKSPTIRKLLEKRIFGHLGSNTRKWMVDEEIAKICLSKMSFQEPGLREQEIPQLKQGKLWHYSLEYWHEHCREAETQSQDISRLLHDRLQEDFCRAHKHESQFCGQISSEDLITALHFSIKYGLKILTKTYLEMGADANAQTLPLSMTALHLAAKSEVPDFIHLLLKRGAEIDVKDALERSPLHCAAEAGSAETIKLLLGNGADLNPKAYSAWVFDQTACDSGCSDDRSRGLILVDRQQSLDLSDDWTCSNDDQDLSYTHPSTTRKASESREARVYFLRQETSSRFRSYSNYASIKLGVLPLKVSRRSVKDRSKYFELKMAILASGITPLHLAVCANKLQAVKILVEAGADVNVRTTSEDMTALDIAALMGHNQILEYLKSCSVHASPKLCKLFPCVSPYQENEHTRIESSLRATSETLSSVCSWLPRELEGNELQEPPCSETTERVFSWLCHDDDASLQTSGPVVKCEQCYQSFQGKQRTSSLKRHLNSVHGKTKFPCEFAGCPKAFSRQDKLRDHMRNIHSSC